jgi:hypothetical protein
VTYRFVPPASKAGQVARRRISTCAACLDRVADSISQHTLEQPASYIPFALCIVCHDTVSESRNRLYLWNIDATDSVDKTLLRPQYPCTLMSISTTLGLVWACLVSSVSHFAFFHTDPHNLEDIIGSAYVSSTIRNSVTKCYIGILHLRELYLVVHSAECAHVL